MGVTNVELGQDVAVDIRGETNGDIVVEYCDMTSLRYTFIYSTSFTWGQRRRKTIVGYGLNWTGCTLSQLLRTFYWFSANLFFMFSIPREKLVLGANFYWGGVCGEALNRQPCLNVALLLHKKYVTFFSPFWPPFDVWLFLFNDYKRFRFWSDLYVKNLSFKVHFYSSTWLHFQKH